MSYRIPTPGSSMIAFLEQSAMWRDMLKMLEWFRTKQADEGIGINQYGKLTPFGHNNDTTDFEDGSLAYVQSVNQPASFTASIDIMKYKPILQLVRPTWHSNIAEIVLLHKSIKKDDTSVVAVTHIGIARGFITKSTDKFCMVDPSQPKYLRSSDAGCYGLIGTLKDQAGNIALVVDVKQSQPYWRYTLTSSWTSGEATATLKRIDGDTYGNITLTDATGGAANQGVGDSGYCVQCGNKFVAVSVNFSGFVKDIRVDGYNLQLTRDGTTWITWHTGQQC